MSKQTFPKRLVALIFVILALQIIAVSFHWYWRVQWLDMLMHFLGGVWVGMSVLWIYFNSGRFQPRIPTKKYFVLILITTSVLVVAVVWELFEFTVYITVPDMSMYDIKDTLSDILFGLMGGFASYLLYAKKYFNSTSEK